MMELLLMVSVLVNLYLAYKFKYRKTRVDSRVILSVGKVDMMTENEYNVIASNKDVIDPLDKWISFLIAKKFEETHMYKDVNDFFRAQGSINTLSLFLAQLRSIKNKAENSKPN